MRVMETLPASWNPAELTAHTEWVRGLALRLVRDSAQADDLVQETFLAALEKRPDQERSLRSVLRGRFALRARRDARRIAREEERATPEALPSSLQLVENAETHALLVQALTKLREPYRTALLLRYFDGKSPAEIARHQGVPAATVRSHLKRGLDELRGRLDQGSGEDRQAWSLALIPLAAGARDAAPSIKILPDLLQDLRAMNPLTLVVVGSTLLVTAAVFVARQFEPLAPGDASPTVSLAPSEAGAQPPLTVPGEAASAAGSPRSTAPTGAAGMALTAGADVLTGIVRDKESGAPLADFSLRITSRDPDDEGAPTWDDAEMVRTDDTGSFTSARAYPTGSKLTISFLDHAEVCQVTRSNQPTYSTSSMVGIGVDWDPAQAPLELTVPVGPTYPLELSAPFDWRAAGLIGTVKPDESGELGVLETCSILWGPVRGEASPWLRFARAIPALPKDRPWVLRVATPDGLFGGEAQVEPGDGLYPETVLITLVPTAKLTVNLLSDTGVAATAVIAQAVDGSTRRILLGGAEEARDDGRFRCCRVLGGVPPGVYDLAVNCTGFAPVQETVTLVAGEELVRDIELQYGPDLSRVTGELRSVSGQYQESVTLHLANRITGLWHSCRPEWEERDGVWVAPFTIDHLVPGEYDLLLDAFGSYYRWDALPLSLVPPREDLVLTCYDTDPVELLKIVVTDARTGEAVRIPYGGIALEGCAHAQQSIVGGGERIYEKVPVGVPMTWWVAAEGYVPQWGTEGAIAGTEPFKDMVFHVIPVALEPGWGARIEARELASRDALAGVEVVVDGEFAGVTDATGRFELTRPQKPAQIDLRREGWHFVRGGYDPEMEELTGIDPTHHVLFARDE